ncbi:YL1 nuclear protein-domain-containing protein [Pavlovales sp. CCMP2436]|nr:YL1 nuclear protein-domain-containing protein [Pavlovales sp. CCMP2436]
MSDSEPSEEEPAPEERKALPARANRGNRMEKLVQEEEANQAEAEFYQQSFWADADGDDEFVETSASDSEASDSDISDAEEGEDDDDDDDDDERPGKRKGSYVDPAAKRAKADKAASAKAKGGGAKAASLPPPDATAAQAKAVTAKEAAVARKRERQDTARADVVAELAHGGAAAGRGGSLRASTIRASVEATEERLRQSAPALKKPAPGAKKRGPLQLRRLTQEELLNEAKQTEIINRASLEAMLKMEEAKRVVPLSHRADAGPRVRVHSKGGRTLVSFVDMDAVPETIRAKAPMQPQPARCVITGLPAKYRDPQTGAPYANLDAFRTIRGRGRSRSQSIGQVVVQ